MLPSAYRTLLAPNKIEADVLGGQPTDPPHVQCFVPSGSSPGRASPNYKRLLVRFQHPHEFCAIVLSEFACSCRSSQGDRLGEFVRPCLLWCSPHPDAWTAAPPQAGTTPSDEWWLMYWPPVIMRALENLKFTLGYAAV
jgi:hypothetical protein